MIDLKKIHDINSKGSFKKFTKKHRFDEPLFLGNYYEGKNSGDESIVFRKLFISLFNHVW